jgi:tetratricopeptide (TPR) repeat protein
MTKTGATTATKRAPRILAGTVPPSSDGDRAHALTLYEQALRLMQSGKFEEACAAFNRLLESNPGDLVDRVRMYINACLQQAAKGKTTFANNEERYDYAVSLLNNGHYEDAREQFQAILQTNDKADYAFYGLAVLATWPTIPASPNSCTPRCNVWAVLQTLQSIHADQGRAPRIFAPLGPVYD